MNLSHFGPSIGHTEKSREGKSTLCLLTVEPGLDHHRRRRQRRVGQQTALQRLWRQPLHQRQPAGQRVDSVSGLYDYNARYYDPSIMMFISPDTLIPDPYNPIDWNRYLYARANPVNLTDPTGHFACGDGIDDPRCEQYENRYKKDQSDDNTGAKICTITNCDPQYYAVAVGVDAPTVITLTGLRISSFAPEVGVPIGLAGLGFELCAYTGSPLCAAVKLASFNAAFTLDTYGNLYVGPQFSWEKSILPVGAASFNMGFYIPKDGHVPTEIEMEDSLQGFSASAGTIATGGLSFSPTAKTNKVAYYMVGFPELFSFNFQYNYLIHDFSP